MTRPRIGVSMNYVHCSRELSELGVSLENQSVNILAEDYTNTIFRSGGIPVLLPVMEETEYTKMLLEDLDGIIISGGDDINPLLSNQRYTSKIGPVSHERDQQELFMIEYALKKEIPLMGICRGFQLINVFLGGTLVLDIPTEGYLDHSIKSTNRYYPVHSVTLSPDSFFEDIFDEEEIWVNSFHHQGVKTLGNNLKSIATSEDHLCEAFEYQGNPLILGIQWHPEMMSIVEEKHLNIFKKFIHQCKNR